MSNNNIKNIRPLDPVLPEVMTVSQAARYLGVNRNVVYRLLKFGELSGVRQNGAILIASSDVIQFSNGNKMM